MKPCIIGPVLAAAALAACATNPVTGGREFSLMSEAQEIQMGQQSDRLGAEYVAEVGWAPSGMSGVATRGRASRRPRVA